MVVINKVHSSFVEEILNTISHFIMGLCSVGAMVLLVILSNTSGMALFCAVIYGCSLIILYFSSAAYHFVVPSKIKNKLRIIDHSSIFLMIAGTYTPVALLAVGGQVGWKGFLIQWSIAFIGIFLKVFFTGRYELLSVCLYAVMGWMALIEINLLYETLTTGAFWLLLTGGIVYTVGIFFYVFDKKLPFGHFIWHLFVIAGSVLHFLMISIYVI